MSNAAAEASPAPLGPPLAEYSWGVLMGGQDDFRCTLYADRIVAGPAREGAEDEETAEAVNAAEECQGVFLLDDLRRRPNLSSHRESFGCGEVAAMILPPAVVCLPLMQPGSPCGGLGGMVACVLGSIGFALLVAYVAPLLSPLRRFAAFVGREGKRRFALHERLPADPAFDAFLERVQSQIGAAAMQAAADPPPTEAAAAAERENPQPAEPPLAVYRELVKDPAPEGGRELLDEDDLAGDTLRAYRLYSDRVEVELRGGEWPYGRHRMRYELAALHPQPDAIGPERLGWGAALAYGAAIFGGLVASMGVAWAAAPPVGGPPSR